MVYPEEDRYALAQYAVDEYGTDLFTCLNWDI